MSPFSGGCRVPEIANGYVLDHRYNHLALHGEHLTVECLPKHEVAEMQSTIVCKNGTWSHQPACIPGISSCLLYSSRLQIYTVTRRPL